MNNVIMYRPHEFETGFRVWVKNSTSIFLAGTIDMGNSHDWQEEMIERFKNCGDGHNYILYNPRRKEGFNNDPEEFKYQVNWELDHLESCDEILMVILGTSKSPITLMELGAFKDKKISVVCEKDFYRYGNVEIFCGRYSIPLYNSIDDYFKNKNLSI